MEPLGSWESKNPPHNHGRIAPLSATASAVEVAFRACNLQARSRSQETRAAAEPTWRASRFEGGQMLYMLSRSANLFMLMADSCESHIGFFRKQAHRNSQIEYTDRLLLAPQVKGLATAANALQFCLTRGKSFEKDILRAGKASGETCIARENIRSKLALAASRLGAFVSETRRLHHPSQLAESGCNFLLGSSSRTWQEMNALHIKTLR
eukprot:3819747-Pleurochrysis_carterae.AAC.1